MKWKLFIGLVFTFIAFTIIGTQTHEWGHYAAAKYLGMNPSLHYQSVEFGEDSISNEGDEIFVQFEKQIISKEDFPLKSRYQYLQKFSSYNYFYSTLWGPLQTIITGTIGFIFIIIFRKRFFNTNALSTSQWLLVFLSLFWLREVFNTFMAGISFFVLRKKEFYGDEFNLCKHLNFPLFSIPIITAIIGFVICSIVTFKFVPKAERKTFIAAGFIGGTIGYIFWMCFLGPLILP